MEIREIHVTAREIRRCAGRAVDPPAWRVVACAVIANPHAGGTAPEDLGEYVDLSVAAGKLLTARALEALGGAKPTAYGKGALVGEAGDLEQGAAMIHCRIGLAMRSAIGAGLALIPGNAKCGGPGASIDIVLGGIDDAWDYDAMDTIEARVPGAPRADEIVLAVAFGTGRPNARIRGASEAAVRDLVTGLRE